MKDINSLLWIGNFMSLAYLHSWSLPFQAMIFMYGVHLSNSIKAVHSYACVAFDTILKAGKSVSIKRLNIPDLSNSRGV